MLVAVGAASFRFHVAGVVQLMLGASIGVNVPNGNPVTIVDDSAGKVAKGVVAKKSDGVIGLVDREGGEPIVLMLEDGNCDRISVLDADGGEVHFGSSVRDGVGYKGAFTVGDHSFDTLLWAGLGGLPIGWGGLAGVIPSWFLLR